MKRERLFIWGFSKVLLFAALIVLGACGGDDEPEPQPTATFTYVADGREVTFTNTSTNATAYEWDFGDGTTSTEQNPVHTYESYGTYTVRLKATGPGGTATSQPDDIALAKSSPVQVDGDISDWADIPDRITSTSGEGGTINAVKVDYDADRIYFLVQGNADLRGFFDIYLDTDNNPETGYASGWYPMGFGADYLIEGDLATNNDADIFVDQAGDPEVWGWDVASAAGTNMIEASDLITEGNGKAIEFSVLRSAFTNLSEDGFSVAVVDVSPDWAAQGVLPVAHTEESKLFFIDLTE